MLFNSIVLAALAQSMVVSAATMQVTVGTNGQFVFTPNTMTAAVGDTVAFQFVSANHSVASSSPNAPCTPDNAVFSDFQNVPNVPAAKNAGKAKATGKGLLGLRAAAPANPPTFSMPVMDTQPMYIYCSQAQHCQQGMVMVINPPAKNARRAATDTTLKQYQAKAAKAKNNVSPTGGVTGGTVTNSQNGQAATKAAKGKGKAGGAAAAAGNPAGALAALVGKGKGGN